jgi:hypothetical protein
MPGRTAPKLRWLALSPLLLWPALAAARSFALDEDPGTPWWLGLGFGSGTITSTAPAPSADRSGIAASIDGGFRFSPEWGLGLEFGVVGPASGCNGRGCSYGEPHFAPDFTHWFLIGELRPGNGGMRLHVGAGLTSMCYSYYDAERPTWEVFLDAVIFGDPVDDMRTTRQCDHLHAFGASASVGYQWPLRYSHTSLGVQLRAEAANFAASTRALTPAFHHRALALQLQLNFN